ncbi:MAG: DUF4118 domain-containing protein [Clostridiales bacterium]|nr:DUF4118 domain-containing protein [Clostridiales bacterium]
MKKTLSKETEMEHILVCLSSSPSNERIVRTAIRMASVFGSQLTALYVKTPQSEKMSAEDRARLGANMRIAEEAGAEIVTTHGEDIPAQIAEYARLSGVTKIVIGIKNTGRKLPYFRPSLTERLIELVPGIDVHIIPDANTSRIYREKRRSLDKSVIPSWKDILITAGLLAAATGIGFLFRRFGFTEANIITVYLLCVLLTSVLTGGYTCGVIGSFLSVILFNYFFTEPRLSLRAYGSGYPVTFAIMLAASILTGTLASKLKAQAKLSARDAFRTKILFDTNRMLERAKDDSEILLITAAQLTKLLDLDAVVFAVKDGVLSSGTAFSKGESLEDGYRGNDKELAAVNWTLTNLKTSGAGTKVFKDAEYLYMPIRSGEYVYGILGISASAGEPDALENSILQSVLGECVLALENHRNAKGREEAAVLAKNEKLRSDLLRSISHDLRTPLTSVSGNADTLIINGDMLDEETKKSLLSDIRDDADWLTGLVENLLSITRISDGSVALQLSDHVVDDVIAEAMQHIDRAGAEHVIEVTAAKEPILARMDARLMIQVIVNLVNNAVKYTEKGSHITVSSGRTDDKAFIRVADDGPGIPDGLKDRVFEMFFTGDNRIGDSRRSLGLGLPLCRSIVEAHGGELVLSDNTPKGCVFTFTLPISEVDLNE